MIRGEFLRIQAFLCKREREQTSQLLACFARFEALHKSSLAASHLQELTEARKELLRRIHKNTKKAFMRHTNIYYKHCNKSGKFLARALKQHQVNRTVSHLLNPQGCKVSTSLDIASQFRDYYESLYNLPGPQEPHTTRSVTIQSFSFCPQRALTLDTPLTDPEISQAIKQLKPCKSPGPDGLYPSILRDVYRLFVPTFQEGIRSAHPSISYFFTPFGSPYCCNSQTRERSSVL